MDNSGDLKIAVTGGGGQLGSELVRLGCIPLHGRLMSEKMVLAIETIKPDAIINCAAMTDVDACEKNMMMAVATNAAGVEFLSHQFRGHLIQLSTDYVFDGVSGSYSVRDTPNPISIYGWTKLGGELFARRHIGPALIVRTTILFSSAKNNFVSKIVAQLERDEVVKLYNANMIGTPTYVPALAGEIMRMINDGYQGLAHVAGNSFMSRLAFARMIAEEFGYDPEMIVDCGISEDGAPRPKKAGLICDYTDYKAVSAQDPLEGLRELANNKKGVL